MMFFLHISSLLLLIALAVQNHAVTDTINMNLRPEAVTVKARVKQHLHGPGGTVKEGEEDRRKIILTWHHIPKADRYEICHNCPDISDRTGEGTGDGGKIYPIGVDNAKYQCGGLPCFIMHHAPLGYNKFHLRVFVKGEWSLWSEYRNFKVEDPGHVEHEEL